MFLVSLESSRQGGMHGLGSMTFGLVVQKVLNNKWFLHWKFRRNWNVPLVLLERSWRAEFNEIYLIMFGFRMWEILIFKWFLLLKIEINSKNRGRKNQLRRDNTWANGTGHASTEVQMKFTNGWSEVQSVSCCVALLCNPSFHNSLTVPPQSPPPSSPPPQRTAQCSRPSSHVSGLWWSLSPPYC
jgi:hypothetical protein